jgi:hypothetical protein
MTKIKKTFTEWTTETNIIVDFLKFKEYAIKHGGDGNDYEFLEAFTQTYKPKLITEQFLLSKGWVKFAPQVFYLNRNCIKLLNEFGAEVNYIRIYGGQPGDHNCVVRGDTLYDSKIPTESQYEVLNQLLELHE